MKIKTSKIPVVTATQGYVFGGGCEIAMHSDAGIYAAPHNTPDETLEATMRWREENEEDNTLRIVLGTTPVREIKIENVNDQLVSNLQLLNVDIDHVHIEDDNSIHIRGARQHNLKNVDLSLPRNKFIVFTGVSGSGKSSLAFDTIFAEGQRRYLSLIHISEPTRPY